MLLIFSLILGMLGLAKERFVLSFHFWGLAVDSSVLRLNRQGSLKTHLCHAHLTLRKLFAFTDRAQLIWPSGKNIQNTNDISFPDLLLSEQHWPSYTGVQLNSR